MDASHLLNLLRNPHAVAAPAPVPAATHAQSSSGVQQQNDLDRLFSAFTNPLAASPAPASAQQSPLSSLGVLKQGLMASNGRGTTSVMDRGTKIEEADNSQANEENSANAATVASREYSSIAKLTDRSEGLLRSLTIQKSPFVASPTVPSSASAIAPSIPMLAAPPFPAPAPSSATPFDAMSLLNQMMRPRVPPPSAVAAAARAAASSAPSDGILAPAQREGRLTSSVEGSTGDTLIDTDERSALVGCDVGSSKRVEGIALAPRTIVDIGANDAKRVSKGIGAETSVAAIATAEVDGQQASSIDIDPSLAIPHPETSSAPVQCTAPVASAVIEPAVSPAPAKSKLSKQQKKKAAAAVRASTTHVVDADAVVESTKQETIDLASSQELLATKVEAMDEDSSRSYLAQNFFNKSLEAYKSLASPTAKKNGVRLLRRRAEVDSLKIDLMEEHLESLYLDQVTVAPITLFKNELRWEQGRRVSAWDNGLCYVTKQGKIRVIDRHCGARLLLKGHSGPLLDLAVSPKCPATLGGQATRLIVSVGSDRKTILWRVPNEFTEETAVILEMVEIVPSSSTITASLVRFSPTFWRDQTVALARSDGTVGEYQMTELRSSIVDWDKEVEVKATKGQATCRVITDFCFSIDGTILALLYQNGQHSVRASTVAAGWPFYMFSTPVPAIASPSQITFLCVKEGSPVALAISSNDGTLIRISSLRPNNQEERTIELIVPAGIEAGVSFGHMQYDSTTSTLFVSNSLRGSIFAFHIEFDADDARVEFLLNDADFIYYLPTEVSDTRVPRVSSISEIPTPEPIVHFYLDDSRRDEDARGSGELSALCVHPKGIHLVTFDHSKVERDAAGSAIELAEEAEEVADAIVDFDGVRRPSLHNGITVSSEVAIKVEEGESDVVTDSVQTSVEQKVTSQMIIKEEEGTHHERMMEGEGFISDIASIPVTLPVSPALLVVESPMPPPSSAATPSVSTQLNAAIKSMKSTKTDRVIKSETASPQSTAVTNAWANGGISASASKKNAKSESMDSVLKEMKKLEDSLSTRVASIVSAELAHQTQRLDEQRRLDQIAEATRQETMLQLVSTTLTTNTSQMVERTIQEQIRSQLIPSVGTLVHSAIKDQIQHGFTEALSKSLPQELHLLLGQPATVAQLARTFSEGVVPSLQRNLAVTIASSIIPQFNASINTAVESMLSSVRLDLAQEHTRSTAAAGLEMKAMKNEMQEMNYRMIRMEAALSASIIAAQSVHTPSTTTTLLPAPSAASSHPRPSRSSRAHPVAVAATSAASSPQTVTYDLPPIPRASTPTERYEEMFTNALQPTHESEFFISLVHLIKSSPATRLDAVFPAPPLRPRITAAVVLSLAFRLAQVIESGDGVLMDEERTMLKWIRRCLLAMDGKDLDTAEYSPRVLESVIESLAQRVVKLTKLNDRRGREEVGVVEKYSRSRLALFI